MKNFHFVEGAWPPQGGVGIGCVPELGVSLGASGVQVVLVCGGPPSPGFEALVQPTVEAALRRRINRGSFGIVSLPSRGKYAFAPSILWRIGPHLRDVEVVTLHSIYSFPVLAGYLLARLWRKPYLLWPHGVLTPFMRHVGQRKKWIYDRLFARRILRGASAVVCTGERERAEVLSLNITERTVVIPHGIALSDFKSLPERGQFRARYLGNHRGPLILYLGRLAAVKNVELLIAAFGRVLQAIPEARLAMVGPPDPASFQETVTGWLREYGVAGQTVLTGPITDLRAKQEALVDADLFAMPSHSENFCHALFEAMASGIPSVVSDSINYAPEVTKHRAGLALPHDPDLFGKGIVELLGNPQIRQEMGNNARRLVAGYAWENCAERIGVILRSVLSGQPLPADLIGRRAPTLEPAP